MPALWTVAHQASLSMGFPNKNTGLGCHFLLWGVFPTQGSNLGLLHWQAGSLPLSHQGSPKERTSQYRVSYKASLLLFVYTLRRKPDRGLN